MIAEKEANDILIGVVALLSRGRIDEGERLFLENCAHLSPAMRLEGLGNLAFYKRDLQSAVDYYESAIALKPERIIARYQYLVGTQEERSGDVVSAFQRYQASIDTDPEFLDAYVELGGLLIKIEDFEGAAQCYRDAVRLAPSDPINLFNLKAVLSRLANQDDRYCAELKEVEEAFDRATDGRGVGPVQGHSW